MVVKPATKFQEFKLSHKKQMRKQSILVESQNLKSRLQNTLKTLVTFNRELGLPETSTAEQMH